MAPSLIIRPIRQSDEATVVPLWMRGFHEAAPSGYAKLTSTPAAFAVFLSLAGGALALGWRASAAALAASGALIYTPAGAALHSALLWLAINAQARSSMRNVTDEWSEGKGAGFWVAELDGVIVGCVGAKAVHTLHRERVAGVPATPGEASVWRLTVAPAARRHRVGAALMDEAERWARARGCGHVSLIAGNPESKRFYKAIAYVAEDERRARRVLFGEAGEPAGAIGNLKAYFLSKRIHDMRTIMVKQLAAAAAAGGGGAAAMPRTVLQ